MRFIIQIFIFVFFSSIAEADMIIHIKDKNGFIDALYTGNAGKIKRLLEHAVEPDIKQLYLAGLSRVEGNIAQSSLHARKCYVPEELTEDSPLSTSSYCGLILAGNALSEGDIATWARVMALIKEKKTPFYQQMAERNISSEKKQSSLAGVPLIKGGYSVDIFNKVKYFTPFKNWAGTMRMVRHTQDSIIPILWKGKVFRGRSGRLPYISFMINGQTVKGLVDTGTEGNIELNSETARKLGISNIIPGWSTERTFGNRDYPSSLGNARTVSVGNSQFRNVPVIITETGDVPLIIGINLLRQLGAFSLSSREMTVYSGRHFPVCISPLSERSELAGDAGPVNYPIIVNGLRADAIIDTGAPMLFYETTRQLPPAPPATGLTSDENQLPQPRDPYQDARTDFNIAGTEYTNEVYPIFQLATVSRFAVGAWVLKHNSITIDFRRGHLCITSSRKRNGREKHRKPETGWMNT